MSHASTDHWNIESTEAPTQVTSKYKSDTPNFWLAAVGLVFLSMLGFVVSLLLANLIVFVVAEIKLQGIDSSNFNAASSRVAYQAVNQLDHFQAGILDLTASFCIWMCMLPVMLWRGGVTTRFTVSFFWVICFALLTESSYYHLQSLRDLFGAKALPMLGVLVAWLFILLLRNIPSIQRHTLIKLFVNYGLMTLAACFSVSNLNQPEVSWIMALHVNYCIVLLVALFVRNYLLFATLEKEATPEDIVPTSTGTLFGLMGICAVLLMFVTALGTLVQGYEIRQFLKVFVTCFATAIAAALIQCRQLTGRPKYRLMNLMLVFPVLGLAVYVGSMDVHWPTSNLFGFPSLLGYSLEQCLWSIPSIVISIGMIIAIVKLQLLWLRYCGWTSGRRG